MRRLGTLILILSGLISSAVAQQDPMFTKYMFNALVYNPAYAGSNEHMSIGLLHRSQWWELEGAPTTQTLTLHTPLANNRVGLGFSILNDRIGPTNTLSAQASYAYRIPLGNGKLAIGLQAGLTNWRADWTKLDFENPQPDPSFDETPNYWMPNFGAGVYYSTEKFFVGFASPHLVEHDLRRQNITDDYTNYARTYRHYFLSAGGVIPLNGKALMFRPILLVKNVGWFSELRKDQDRQNIKAPTEFDIDLSLLFFERFWLGTAFRSSIEVFDNERSSYDSADIWASYFMPNGLRIGAAFDYPLTQLNTVTAGAFEIMVGYEFNYQSKKIVTPRYF
ncbi:MAG: type IX secretion system membrane protein PorP/SprF [Lewinellaceae bacterium]|nr:type IX secretion system membrane protein PorP/SprF [Lewinellaceae bacterium]HRW76296.1 type IX secretion system membrane protein PorP/SprF [Saprospiraceae bacterium]